MRAVAFPDGWMQWCERAARHSGGRRMDRDDLFSAAMESVWIAANRGVARDVMALAKTIFARKKWQLLRQAYARKRGGGMDVVLSLTSDDVPQRTDPMAFDPLLMVMAADLESKPGRRASTCLRCRTKGGSTPGDRGQGPIRIRGMCRSCYRKSKGWRI